MCRPKGQKTGLKKIDFFQKNSISKIKKFLHFFFCEILFLLDAPRYRKRVGTIDSGLKNILTWLSHDKVKIRKLLSFSDMQNGGKLGRGQKKISGLILKIGTSQKFLYEAKCFATDFHARERVVIFHEKISYRWIITVPLISVLSEFSHTPCTKQGSNIPRWATIPARASPELMNNTCKSNQWFF